MGYDVTVFIRSIPLRGFDRESAENIATFMSRTGTTMKFGTTPTSVTKKEGEGGGFVVKYHTKEDKDRDTKEEDGEETFDTVFSAVGRDADTKALGLENIGVTMNKKSGKIMCEKEQSVSVPSIYAIGDCVEGVPELTPVAIQSGRLLARRLFAAAPHNRALMDYDTIPTTVFTPLEYGACGLSEETAKERYGDDGLEIFHAELDPLEWSLAYERHEHYEGLAKAKLVCVKDDDLRVVGFHYLGPNAGEVTQGFAVAMRKGMTYEDVVGTVGIHPSRELGNVPWGEHRGGHPGHSGKDLPGGFR